MKHYVREVTKAQKRLNNFSNYKITDKLFDSIMEPDFFLEKTNRGCVADHNGFQFSMSFVSNVRSESLDDFVFDGTLYWYDTLNLAKDAELKRLPSLFQVMYDYLPQRSVSVFLKDNPWLFSKFGVFDPTKDSIICKSVQEVYDHIKNEITEDTNTDYIPLGRWGLDIIFSKRSVTGEGKFFNSDNKYLVSVSEYKGRII